MCENPICDYPASVTEAKRDLEEIRIGIEDILKELGEDSAWANKLCEQIKNGEQIKNMCPVCCLNNFILSLIFNIFNHQVQLKNKELVLVRLLSFGLNIGERFAVNQHAVAVMVDAYQKVKNSQGVDFQNFSFWLTDRLLRLEYKQPQHTTENERELMRWLRKAGSSLRELRFIFDRSLSTVQDVCRGVEPTKTDEYDY
ncbi:hypothetical protein ES707_20570 [subsurface metagenome]